MNTPIIETLLPRLRETVSTQMKNYLGGEGELSGIYDSLEFWWDGIRDREFPELPMWDELPTPDKDRLFDEWISGVEVFFASRGKPVGPSNSSGACAPSAGTDVPDASKRTAQELFREWWNTYQLDKLAGYGPEEKEDHMREAFLGGFLAAPDASCTSPAPLVPEVVKVAQELLERLGRGYRPDHEIHVEISQCIAALRSYSPVPSPSVELLREARNGLEYAMDVFQRSADRGFYPWAALTENGGQGFKPVSDALSKLNAALA